MKKPKMILFDSGGTLCYDVDYDTLRATRAIMPYITKNPRNVSAEELHAALRAAHESFLPARAEGYEISQWTMMLTACGKNGVELSLDGQSFERVFRLALTPVEMTPHIDELLNCLNAAGIRTGVISNSKYSGLSLSERLNKLLPENRFEFFISSCDYAVCKPKKTLFEIALAKAGLPAHEVWYCGDSVRNDVVGAQGAGMFPVLYDAEGTRRESGETLGIDFLTVSDWRELIEELNKIE